jgi:hypothetical protein
MSMKNEKYPSKKAMMKHEKSEGKMERRFEYSGKAVKKAAVKKPAVKKNIIPPDYDVILPGMGYTKPTKKNPPKKKKGM